MTGCATYVAPIGLQLKSGGVTGPFDCSAWAARILIGQSTCGAKLPSGRTIRLQSSEPVPERDSPGLNIPQVADVAYDHYGVYFEQRIGSRALDWDEYEARRKGGEPMLVQLHYAAIADSRYDAGRGFRSGHAMAETQHSSYDSLADGRAAGVWKHDGRVYDRSLMKEAAGQLIIGTVNGHPRRVGFGKVWCAVGRDRTPKFEVSIHPARGKRIKRFNTYTIRNGVITGYRTRETRGFTLPSHPPRAFRWPTRDRELRYLIWVPERGFWVHGKYGDER